MRPEHRHSELVYQTASSRTAAVNSPVAASWIRCLDLHHLVPEEARVPHRIDEGAFRAAKESLEPLLETCAEEFDRLFQTVGRSGCAVVIADRNGVIVDRRSTASDDVAFHKLGLWQQNVWSEASAGTNGIGTALADERLVVIHQKDHFLSSNIALSCVTAPIRDHRGQIAAALDISTCRDDINELTLNMLAQAARETACRVEIQLFRLAFQNARIVMVPTPGAATPALLAVDFDDIVIGATRGARSALKLDDAMIAQGIPASDALKEERHHRHADLDEAERAALRRVLSRCNGNVSQAAPMLGISRSTLHRKMKRLGVQ